MADDTEDQSPQDQQPTPAPQQGMAPALQAFQGAFTDPDSQDWAGEVSTRLNDYFTRRNMADNNLRAGDNFVNDLSQFKNGLVNMVTADPGAVHTALDIVPPTIGGLIGTMPGQPEDAQTHHDAVVGDIQTAVGRAAIMSMAERHEGMARGMLADDRLSGLFDDQTKGALDSYINLQAGARIADNAATLAQNQRLGAQATTDRIGAYVGELTGPNGELNFPPNWNQGVMADHQLPPDAKIQLSQIHTALAQTGDAQTDPMAVIDAVNNMANGGSQRDIYPQIGKSLSLQDAQTLATASKTPSFMPAFAQTLDAAQAAIASHGGVAETQALGRFINWIMPEIRNGGSLNPRSQDYILPTGPDAGQFWQQFKPRGDDLVIGEGRSNEDTRDRPSLGDIFGRGAGRKLSPRSRMPVIPDTPDNNPEIKS